MDHNASPEGGITFMLAVVTAVGLSTWLFFFSLPTLLGTPAPLQPDMPPEQQLSFIDSQHRALHH